MAEFTITQTDSGYSVSLSPTEITISPVAISGYGIQGLPGPQGEQGIQGIPGPQGPKGDAASIADVAGLTEALAGKAALVHTHVVNDITDFDGTVLAGGTF